MTVDVLNAMLFGLCLGGAATWFFMEEAKDLNEREELEKRFWLLQKRMEDMQAQYDLAMDEIRELIQQYQKLFDDKGK